MEPNGYEIQDYTLKNLTIAQAIQGTAV